MAKLNGCTTLMVDNLGYSILFYFYSIHIHVLSQSMLQLISLKTQVSKVPFFIKKLILSSMHADDIYGTSAD